MADTPDWIDLFMDYTQALPSPEIFRLWTGLVTLAGAVERRVFVNTSNMTLYPNLFILLVAPPGVGKDVSRLAKAAWRGAQTGLHISPDDITKASLLDCLSRASREDKGPAGEPLKYHYLNVLASEFGVFVPSHDTNFLSVLSKLYDPNDVYEEERRGRIVGQGESKVMSIENPLLNMFGGVQPGYLSTLLPEAAWQQGFTSRMIMIYSAVPVNVPLFSQKPLDKNIWLLICMHLKRLASLKGHFKWEDDAAVAIEEWKRKGCMPLPKHTRLANYSPRRILHVLKLCMVSSLARGPSMIITLKDFERARGWLLLAEKKMPDIFRDMLQHPDSKILEELQIWGWNTYLSQGQKLLSTEQVLTFLSNCMPSEKVDRMLELAVATKRLLRHHTANGVEYMPSNKGDEEVV